MENVKDDNRNKRQSIVGGGGDVRTWKGQWNKYYYHYYYNNYFN